MKKLLFGLLAASGFIVVRKILTATKLKFYPKGVKLTGQGLFEQKLWLIAEVVNPSFNQLTINNIFLTIYADDKLIGRVEVNTPIVIGGNGTTIINIPIKLNVGGLTYMSVNYFVKGIKPKFKIVGTVNSGGAQIPLEQTIDLL